jgi:hypothetical protein
MRVHYRSFKGFYEICRIASSHGRLIHQFRRIGLQLLREMLETGGSVFRRIC